MLLPRRKLLHLLQYGAALLVLSLCGFALVQVVYDKSQQRTPENKVLKEQLKDNAENGGLYRDPQTLPDISGNEKIDWHNYTQIKEEAKRSGPGEQGKALILSEEEKSGVDELFSSNGFSGYISDQISVHRAVNDIRHKDCKSKLYLKKLPSVSVIIPYHNEHFSTLLRTFHSVLNRSPKHLLKEIILIDDASTKGTSKSELHDYLEKNGLSPLVQAFHLPDRSGLIGARMAGARKATAEVLIFLDSHTEANVNWLPPLLEPIAEDYRTATCPFIDVIDFNNFEYRAQDEGARGAFDWQLYYKRLPRLPESLKHPVEPFDSPVMAGGLFAISAKWFWELEGYDEGLKIWGGEQYELSFKIWQCGGRMVDTPCSRIGHIYRKFAPFTSGGAGDYLSHNYRRVAEVWMDEYAEYIYQRRPHYRNINPGDLTKQKALRERLKCKPFKWFMEKIAFDLPLKYPPVEPPDYANGSISSVNDPSLCIDGGVASPNSRLGITACGKGHEQFFHLPYQKDIRLRRRSMCLDVSEGGQRAPIVFYTCHGGKGNQLFKYDYVTQQIIHSSRRCLDYDPDKKDVFVSNCDDAKKSQRWAFTNFDPKLIDKWDFKP